MSVKRVRKKSINTKRGFLILFLLFISIPIIIFLSQNTNLLSNLAKGKDTSPISIGPEEIVYDGSSPRFLPDYTFFTFKSKLGREGIFSNGRAGVYRVPFLEDPSDQDKIQSLVHIPGLIAGKKDSDFDQGGVWPNGVYQDPNLPDVIHMYYHAENYKDPTNANNTFSAGYARSNDGGVTWEKPGHPNNQILSGYRSSGARYGADPYAVIPNGNHLYLYYFEHSNDLDKRGVALARAPISSGGVPGSWKKYYCDKGICDFTEPGIGGKFTRLEGFKGQPWVSYNVYLNKFIAIDGWPITQTETVQFKYSPDGIHWADLGDPVPLDSIIPPELGDWKRVYFSMVSLQGQIEASRKNFYLYYVLISWDNANRRPSQNSARRQLIRRVVTLNMSPLTLVKNETVPISEVFNSETSDHLYLNTKVNPVPAGYTSEFTAFNLVKFPDKDARPFFAIQTPFNGHHFYTDFPHELEKFLSTPGYVDKGMLGYCYYRGSEEVKARTDLVPLYRLFNPKEGDFYYSTNPKAIEHAKETGWREEGVQCYVPKSSDI